MDADQLLLNLYKEQQYNETRIRMHKIFMLIAALASALALVITMVFYSSWMYELAFGSMILCVVILSLLVWFHVLKIGLASYLSMLYACFVFVPVLWLESGMIGNTPYISLIILVAVLSLFSGKQLHWMLGGYLALLAILVTYTAIVELPVSDNIPNYIYMLSAFTVAIGLIVIYMLSKQREFNDLNDRFLRSSFKDELTQLYNRKLMDIIIEYQEKQYKREKLDYIFVMFDVDDFKKLNDERGHVYGDIVLRTIAKCINDKARSSDFVIRYGGDEFLVVQTSASEASIQTFSSRIEEAMKDSCQLDMHVTASYGYAARSECASPDAVMKLADERLYENKQARKAATASAEPAAPKKATATRKPKPTGKAGASAE